MGQTGLRTRRWRLMLAALAAIAALGAAGCGGGDEEAAPPPAAPAEPAEPPAEPPAETAAPPAETGEPPAETGVAPPEAQPSVTDYAAYVGGSGAADASLTPIKIGYINQEGGPIEIGKTADDGVAIGAKFINEQAGGIGGHPVEIVNCFIAQNEEEGQQCGQQFANDPEIVAIVTGAVAIGSESLHAALAGSKPVVVGVSVNAFDTTAENTAILFGDSQYILAPYATFARDTLGVQVRLAHLPGGRRPRQRGGRADHRVRGGRNPDRGRVLSRQYDRPDHPAHGRERAGRRPRDAGDQPRRLRQVPAGDPRPRHRRDQGAREPDLPDAADDRGSRRLPQVDLRDRVEAHLRRDRSGRAGVPGDPESQGPEAAKFIGDPWTNVGFGEILTLAKWLNALGPDNITTDGIVEQMLAFTGPLALGSPEIQCGQYPDAPGVCNDLTQFYQYFGADATPAPMQKAGDWVPPPEGWVAPF